MQSAARSKPKLTYDDLQLLPDDGMRHEIIDGELFVTASPNRRHQKVLGRLYLQIGNFLEVHPEVGEAYLAPFDVVLSYWDVVEPDLLFVASDQDILTPTNVQGPPALVVEIGSPSTRRLDQHLKRELFARTGVREYWVVDPDKCIIAVHRRDAAGELVQAFVLAVGADALTTALLPGLEVRLDALFA
jgi:Uma2 family endonuclease